MTHSHGPGDAGFLGLGRERDERRGGHGSGAGREGDGEEGGYMHVGKAIRDSCEVKFGKGVVDTHPAA